MAGRFLFFAVFFTWIAWIPAVLISGGEGWSAHRILLYVGGLGPVAALLVVLAPRDQTMLRQEFFRRLTDTRALLSPAMLLALSLPAILALLGLLTYVAAHGADAALPSASRILILALPVLLFGPLPEELAWRGYGLPLLLKRYGPFAATLMIASVWSIWHVPLFFMEDTYQANLTWSTGEGWLFFGNLYMQSLIMTALLMASRSIWSAVAFHWMTNLAGEVLQLPPVAEFYRSGWTLLVMLLILILPAPFGLRKAGDQKEIKC